MRLDGLDAAILNELGKDARLSYRELAGHVGSTTPTVSARVKALEELGIIQQYRLELNQDVLGGALRILIAHVKPSAANRIADALAAYEAAERVEVLAGGRVLVHFRERLHQGVRAPHELLAKDPDVVSYEVAEVLAAPRTSPTRLDSEGVEVPCHQCKGPIHGAPIRATLEGRAHVFCCSHCLDTFRGRVHQMKGKQAQPHRH